MMKSGQIEFEAKAWGINEAGNGYYEVTIQGPSLPNKIVVANLDGWGGPGITGTKEEKGTTVLALMDPVDREWAYSDEWEAVAWALTIAMLERNGTPKDMLDAWMSMEEPLMAANGDRLEPWDQYYGKEEA